MLKAELARVCAKNGTKCSDNMHHVHRRRSFKC